MSNNNNVPTSTLSTLTYAGEAYNSGLLSRQYRTAYDPTSTSVGAVSQANTDKNALRPYFYYNQNSGAGSTFATYYVIATIRLKDLSSFFEKSPLTKGFYSRIDLTMNMGSFRTGITATSSTPTALAAAGNPVYGTFSNIVFTQAANDINFNNGTCPIMLTQEFNPGVPAIATFPIGGAATPVAASIAQEVIVGLYIGRVTSSVAGRNGAANQSSLGVSAHQQPSCLLYSPMIEMKPERALSYITQNKNKLIRYETLNNQMFYNNPSNSMFYLNLTTGLTDVVGILMIPFISGTNNTAAGVAIGFSPCISPFASEPSTSSPIMISNINVQVSGVNILQKNISYDFEFFLQELYGVNSINGNQSTGLKSGLIDQLGFENIYRYYYVNLERRTEDAVSKKSITISGLNDSGLAIDIFTCIITRNSLVIDVETGKVVAQGLESQY